MNNNQLFAFNGRTQEWSDPYDYRKPLSLDSIRQIDALVKDIAQRRDVQAMNDLFAHRLLMPIFDVAAYEAWTGGFWIEGGGSPGEIIRYPIWSYVGMATQSAPLGTPTPVTVIGRKYGQPSWTNIQSAFQTDWDTMAYAGWDYTTRAVKEIAWEMARQIDVIAKPILDTAAAATTGHNPTVATTMTKAAFDSVVTTAALAGFPIRFVAINRATAMDTLKWVWPAALGFLQYNSADKWTEAFNNGYIDGYLGIRFVLSKDVPRNIVYFAGAPEYGGYKLVTPTRAVFDQDVRQHFNYWAWDAKVSHTYLNNLNIYTLTIT